MMNQMKINFCNASCYYKFGHKIDLQGSISQALNKLMEDVVVKGAKSY
jgi:hypothetical protein